MEGFILAAGLGTRLQPLTNDRPKALVEVGGITLLEMAIHRLEAAGICHIVVNVHHFADKVIDFINNHSWQASIDISDERALLLDTGGGLKKAGALFSGKENVLVHNVDILSNIDLRALEAFHRQQDNLVTLCVSQRNTKRLLEFDEKGLLRGRATDSSTTASRRSPSPNLGEELKSINHCNSTSTKLGEGDARRADGGVCTSALAFSGISVVSPELFALLPEADHPYPIIDEYIRLSGEGHRIGAYIHPAEHWLDVGKPETLEKARQWTRS